VPPEGPGRKDPRPLGLPDFSRGRPPRRSRGVVWVVGAVVLVVGLGVFGLVSWIRVHNRPVTPARVPENREEIRQEMREAFVLNPLEAGQRVKELKPLFEDLGRALDRGDADGVAAHFDAERRGGAGASWAAFALPTARENA